MTAAIFDGKAIAERRDRLFGSLPRQDTWLDYERSGSPTRHCGICPKDEEEPCHLSCIGERGKLEKKDGVTVT